MRASPGARRELVRASSAARTASPASSSRFSAATAATTCVESVRCFPPSATSPPAASCSSSASRTACSSSAPATLPRNSDRTESSNPGSSSGRPIRYFQSSRIRTASAAIRSVSFSARCSTVTSASRDGDHPGRPRSPNADANSPSCSHSPSRSRICTASGRGVFLPRYMDAIAAVICGSGSGQAAGCMDMTYPILRPERGARKEERPQTAPWPVQPPGSSTLPGVSRINQQDRTSAQSVRHRASLRGRPSEQPGVYRPVRPVPRCLRENPGLIPFRVVPGADRHHVG